MILFFNTLENQYDFQRSHVEVLKWNFSVRIEQELRDKTLLSVSVGAAGLK